MISFSALCTGPCSSINSVSGEAIDSLHVYLPVSEVVTEDNMSLSPLLVSLEVSIAESFTIQVTDTVTSTDGVRA